MDEATLRLRLGAYRTGGQDADDPLLAEARRELERNPELVAWFAEEQRFDALMVRKLQEVSAPAGLQETLLLNARTPRLVTATPAWRRHARNGLALAAGLALAFCLGRWTRPRNAPAPSTNGGEANGLALRAIAYTGRMPALDFVCFSAAEVAEWVTRKSSEMEMGQLLDRPVPDMQMIGSSAARWEGRPVIMIALQNGGRMAMLYVVRASDFPEAATSEAGVLMEKDGWSCKTGRRGAHVFVLTTKGSRQDLDFPMPL